MPMPWASASRTEQHFSSTYRPSVTVTPMSASHYCQLFQPSYCCSCRTHHQDLHMPPVLTPVWDPTHCLADDDAEEQCADCQPAGQFGESSQGGYRQARRSGETDSPYHSPHQERSDVLAFVGGHDLRSDHFRCGLLHLRVWHCGGSLPQIE